MKGGDVMNKIFIFLFLFTILLCSNVLALIDSPLDDEILGSANVSLTLTPKDTSIRNTFLYLNQRTLSWVVLCKDNFSCSKNIRFSEGDNQLIVKSIDANGETDEQEVSFFVDSKKPLIIRDSPMRNSLTNQESFFISYSENNLEDITLNYGIPWDMRSVSKTDCPEGINKKCDFSEEISDISDFEGETIDAYYTLFDGINFVQSSIVRVKVDTTPPQTEINYLMVDKNRVKFIIDVDEINFKDIIYEDNSDCGQKSKTSGIICSKLSYGRCVITKSFCKGTHELTITTRDKAGNSVSEPLSLFIG